MSPSFPPDTMKFSPLISLLLATGALALDSYDVTSITVNDSGNSNGAITINKNGSTVVSTDGDVNLVNFKVGATTYNAGDFISGVGTKSNIASSDIGAVIQYSSATADGTLAYGSPDDLSDYLTQGERGLSFSSALNFTASGDDAGSFSFDLRFNSDPTLNDRPTFIVGDGANNQSIDRWSFLDENGSVLFSFDLGPTNFNTFGEQVIDRVLSDNSGFRGNDNQLDIGLAAFSLTTDDLNGADWAAVRTLSIDVPASGESPMTDYAFFGVDTGIIESTGLVVPVPEPSSSGLILLGSLTLLLLRKRST